MTDVNNSNSFLCVLNKQNVICVVSEAVMSTPLLPCVLFWPRTSDFVMRRQEGREGVPSQGRGGYSSAGLWITLRGGTVPAL